MKTEIKYSLKVDMPRLEDFHQFRPSLAEIIQERGDTLSPAEAFALFRQQQRDQALPPKALQEITHLYCVQRAKTMIAHDARPEEIHIELNHMLTELKNEFGLQFTTTTVRQLFRRAQKS